jgi:hypothetical protein
MLPNESEVVPITALEPDATFHYLEEATPAEAHRISPLEDSPVAVLEQVLDDAGHIGFRELIPEHRVNGVFASYGLLNNLVIGRIVGIQIGDRVGIRPVEGFNPDLDDFFWCSNLHSRHLTIQLKDIAVSGA